MNTPTIEAAIQREYADAYGKITRRRWGLSAFISGYQAAQNGEGRNICPYPDYRTTKGQVTFSRAYGNKWRSGWDMYYKLHREHDPGYHLP